jgi:hypothetical protein
LLIHAFGVEEITLALVDTLDVISQPLLQEHHQLRPSGLYIPRDAKPVPGIVLLHQLVFGGEVVRGVFNHPAQDVPHDSLPPSRASRSPPSQLQTGDGLAFQPRLHLGLFSKELFPFPGDIAFRNRPPHF